MLDNLGLEFGRNLRLAQVSFSPVQKQIAYASITQITDHFDESAICCDENGSALILLSNPRLATGNNTVLRIYEKDFLAEVKYPHI
jgi:hypothetical protein